jgi:hypothetical protein
MSDTGTDVGDKTEEQGRATNLLSDLTVTWGEWSSTQTVIRTFQSLQ